MDKFDVLVIESQMPKSAGMKIIRKQLVFGKQEAVSIAEEFQEKYPGQRVEIYRKVEF